MDIVVKEEYEIADVDELDISLQSTFDFVVKVIKEEITTTNKEGCTTQAILKCKICPFKTLQKQRLEVHLRTHPQSVIIKEEIYVPEVQMKHEEIILDDTELELEINLKCELCTYKTSQMKALESHFIRKHNMQRISVSTSDYISDSLVEMEVEEILKRKNRDLLGNVFTCKLCNYKTLQIQRYKTHIQTHKDVILCFKCIECDFMAKSGLGVEWHKLNHAFKCKFCRYRASSRYYLNLHMKTHGISKIFKCDKCSYTSDCNYLLICHQKAHVKVVLDHDNVNPFFINLNFDRIEDKERFKKIDMPFKCDECSYKTLRQDYLDRHMIFHHKNKLFSCSECGQKFALQRSLLLHVKNHVKQKD